MILRGILENYHSVKYQSTVGQVSVDTWLSINQYSVDIRPIVVQLNLDYPDLNYPDYSIIQTLFSGSKFFININ